MRVRIRPSKPGDINFVCDSFRNVVAYSSGIQRAAMGDGVSRLLDRLLSNPRTQVDVAVDAERDHKIVGYALVTGDILSMVLVVREHRRSGACRALLDGLPRPLRCWWPHRNLEHVARCAPVVVDPLALLEL